MKRTVGVVGRALIPHPAVRPQRKASRRALPQGAICRSRPRRKSTPPGPGPATPAAGARARIRSLPCGRQSRSSARCAPPRSGSPMPAPPSTAQTAMGSDIPLTSRRPRLRKVNRSPSSARVEAATTTAPGSARLWSRAATFGASPTVACCSDASPLMRSPTTTSPVAMAIRTSTRSVRAFRAASIAAMMSRPARTARSASSSCARG